MLSGLDQNSVKLETQLLLIPPESNQAQISSDLLTSFILLNKIINLQIKEALHVKLKSSMGKF